jgi:hypothetical protein
MYAQPLAGNRAFAAEYAPAVPDTWHVINDQDVVVHGLKLWGWYKRNGNRAIVNRSGDLVVRPSLLEISLLQAWPSAAWRVCSHGSYCSALVSQICSPSVRVTFTHTCACNVQCTPGSAYICRTSSRRQ